VFALNRAPGVSNEAVSISEALQLLAPGLAFAAVGALVASRRPRNSIGWLFLAFGLFTGLFWLSAEYAYYAIFTSPGSLPGGRAVASMLDGAFVPQLALLTFIALLFPNGRLPSRRWRPAAAFAAASYAVMLVSVTVVPGPLDSPFQSIENPFGIEPRGVVGTVVIVCVAGALLSVVAAFGAVATRFRRGGSDERAQLKWFASAAALVPLFLVAHSVAEVIAPRAVDTVEAFFTLVVTAFPVATGIAVLKYRLYDIDRIISRAVSYGVLSALLGGAYFGLVIALQQVFDPLTKGSDLAIAGSTLAVAALFRPGRRRVQALVDRRFYRRGYDAARTLEAFSVRLRREIDLDSLATELGAVARDNVQPAHVSLWLRDTAVALPVTIPRRSLGTKEME